MRAGLWHKLFDCQQQQAAGALYERIMGQSRQPFFFQNGLDDTMDKRFELLMLHLFLVLNAMKQHQALEEDAQQLFDYAFSDMDRTLREIGVGDLSVGKKVRGLAEIFYGRVKQYQEALAAPSPALSAVVQLAFGQPESSRFSRFMTGYITDSAASLLAQPPDAFTKATLAFAPLPETLG